jgi:hypothetical protein
MARVRYRTVTAHADGSIDYVSLIEGTTGDAIVWLVENPTAVRIKVKVQDFRKYNNNHQPGPPIDPIRFLVDSCTVDPGDLPGIIMGQITLLPTRSNPTVSAKYTISVKAGTGPFIDHDPDLDIDRPSGF